MEKKEKRYLIPVDGKLYETSEEVYRAYYKMSRRERYLEEVSRKKNLSLEALKDAEYPVEEQMLKIPKGVDDEAIKNTMIELLLKKLSILSDYEIWLVQEIYTHGKSERQIESESDIPRKTLAYQREKILRKLRKAMGC